MKIHYISFGTKINKLTMKSIDSLLKNIDNTKYNINIITDKEFKDYKDNIKYTLVDTIDKSNIVNSRYYKTKLFDYSDDFNLYLDSDTIILSEDLFKVLDILQSGFDLVIAPSTNQDDSSFWHVSKQERENTLTELEYNPLQLQGGMFAWAKNSKTEVFFKNWFNEWNKYKEQDQAALIRALELDPIKYYLVSNTFNGGSVLKHNFGATK